MSSSSGELTVPQTAALLGLAEETIRRHIRANRLRARKRGTQWFITRTEIESFRRNYQPRVGRRLG